MFFKDQGLIALTSDARVDFTPADFNSPLNQAQRAYLREQCGVDIPKVFWRKQVHGDEILEVHGWAKAADDCPQADAFITGEKNLPIAIRTADCVPVFIFDPVHRAIGLAHAGWKGACKMIASLTVRRMREKFASEPSGLRIVLGPCIRECCYQVGVEFRAYFPSHLKERGGHLYLDLIGAHRDQLARAQIPPENILDSGVCTCCNKDYFSFRREGDKAGRMISLMMLV